MKTEVLKLLKERDEYVSGQEICDRLQVSRTAVWKIMKQLQSEGYEIQAVRNRGYRLLEVADVMTEAELRSSMDSVWTGGSLVYYEETDSTNTRAKKLAEEGAGDKTLVVTEHQTAGKGRRGRSWVAEKGSGIWMSLLLRPQISPSSASMLTLVAALAVAQGIEKISGLDTKIKWPNDIVCDGKKVCGILTEMSAELETIHYVIVGIGINVTMTNFPEELKEKASSLCLLTGKTISRSPIVAAVLQSFEDIYAKFLEAGDLSTLLEEYEQKLANKNCEVTVLDPSETYRGVCLGIDKTGELLVQLKDGTINRVVSGEVSVRGIYGYV